MSGNRALFEIVASRYGAVRGFAVNTPEEFESVVQTVQPTLLDYVGGDSPRPRITGKVYTSTEYPETYQIYASYGDGGPRRKRTQRHSRPDA